MSKRDWNKVKRHPLVAEAWCEDHGEDRSEDYWVSLKPGYWHARYGVTGLHEYSPGDMLARLAECEPDPR